MEQFKLEEIGEITGIELILIIARQFYFEKFYIS